MHILRYSHTCVHTHVQMYSHTHTHTQKKKPTQVIGMLNRWEWLFFVPSLWISCEQQRNKAVPSEVRRISVGYNDILLCPLQGFPSVGMVAHTHRQSHTTILYSVKSCVGVRVQQGLSHTVPLCLCFVLNLFGENPAAWTVFYFESRFIKL